MYTFPNFEPVHCSRSNSNCCFLTCMHVSQEASKVVWYFHLLKNFPVCCDPHKSFSQVSETDFFLEFCCSMIQWMLAIWSLVPLSLLNPACTSGSSWFMYWWSLAWKILSITLLTYEKSAIELWTFFGIALLREWNENLVFSSPVATAEFSKFAGILSAVLSQHHLRGFERAQLEFHHLH